MWKVLIADDEPKIRRGLRNLVNWQELDMEVVGEAEDGEMALEQVVISKPDIVLVDICMPFLNGLEFIKQLKKIAVHCLIIVITGHDEFTYAQQAIKLSVFDYLLKPVEKEHLLAVLKKAGQKVADFHVQEQYMSWANQTTKKNLSMLRENFCNEWMSGRLTAEYIAEQLHFLEITLTPASGIILIKSASSFTRQHLLTEWDKNLLLFAMANIAEDLLATQGNTLIFKDNKEHIVAITPLVQLDEWYQKGVELERIMEDILHQVILVLQEPVADLHRGISSAYQQLLWDMNKKTSCSPVVLLSQRYIDTHYNQEDLSLQHVAQVVQMSPTYLSRLLKQEIGISFVDYLTHVRVQKAIQLIQDPAAKLYEVAEQVGYANQHYFSTAFKKVLGMSPAEYRKRGIGS